MRKINFILITITIFCDIGISQQTPIYSQYVLNEFIINPSVAGIDGMTLINFTGRKQWLGWEFAPETYSASVSTRILKSINPFIRKGKPGTGSLKRGTSGRVGLGASIVNDKNGAINKTNINLTYAYHLSIQNSQLSFGLSLLANQFRIDDEIAKLGSSDDPLTGLIGKSTYSPDAAMGINFSGLNYMVGMSIFNLLQSPVKFGETSVSNNQLRQVRHYHILATYRNKFRSKPKWKYESSIIARGNEYLQGSADISIRFIYNDEYWAGLSARTSGDIIVIMGMKFDKLYFGYSFDYGLNEFSKLSHGSHEIVIALKFGDSTRRYRWWERY